MKPNGQRIDNKSKDTLCGARRSLLQDILGQNGAGKSAYSPTGGTFAHPPNPILTTALIRVWQQLQALFETPQSVARVCAATEPALSGLSIIDPVACQPYRPRTTTSQVSGSLDYTPLGGRMVDFEQCSIISCISSTSFFLGLV